MSRSCQVGLHAVTADFLGGRSVSGACLESPNWRVVLEMQSQAYGIGAQLCNTARNEAEINIARTTGAIISVT